MCGHEGYTSIATWARNQTQLAIALGYTYKNTPCAGTIHNVLKMLDVAEVEKVLTKTRSKHHKMRILKTK